VGASAEALVSFYQGDRLRILVATVLGGLAVLNLMWFAAAATNHGFQTREGEMTLARMLGELEDPTAQ
jgi:hypothetical protein